jgi:polysaccharide export outer membrane protein
VLASCGNIRDLQYLQGQFDTLKLSQAHYAVPVIQKNDLLSVTVYSDDPRASAYYNLPSLSTVNNSTISTEPASAAVGANYGSSYLVDQQGNIQMPGLGRFPVAGLTTGQVDSLIVSKLQGKLNNPYTIVRYNSFKITLMGEVTKPGQFTIPNEKISLLEAIALAGDLTPFARRDNVLLIREINGERTYQRLNLKDPNVLNSPYFFLQPNDLIIVDPNKSKAAASDQVVVRNISLAVSLISVISVIITLSRTK